MQLSKLFTCFALAVVSSSSLFVKADEFSDLDQIHQLFKREDKLPFDSLPAGNCTAPAACSNIGQPATCHCNDVLTVCQNNQGQFCWGSKTLNQNTGCPAAPSPCSDSFNGTASCLCNSQAVLCVDQYNHYCYGNIGAGGSAVSLAAIPTGSQAASSSANGLPSNAPTAGSSGTDNGNPSNPSSSGSRLTTSLQYSMGVLALAVVVSL